MRYVYFYSMLLISGLVASQFMIGVGSIFLLQWLTMFTLAYIMIHVGYEFEIDKSRPRQYAWDYVVAATAAAFPWIFCAAYFVYVMGPPLLWTHPDMWKEALLEGRFASPTSAGVLFSMLAAAGLATTWVFKKARILAIFDDLDTILLMVPLTFMMVGFRWQLLVLVAVMLTLLWLAWRYLDSLRLPITWPYIVAYSAILAGVSETVHLGSKWIDAAAPIHLEVLLPAFVLGCMLAPPRKPGPKREGHENEREAVFARPAERRANLAITSVFMVLVGLSMPPIMMEPDKAAKAPEHLRYEGVAADVVEQKHEFPSWWMMGVHVAAITVLSNIGKMFPAFCYRREASFRERLAVAICMFPRGEVGAGVLVVSLSYGVAGPAITVAVLSLALNLLGTGAFIVATRKLIQSSSERSKSPEQQGARPAFGRPRLAEAK